MNLNNQRKLAAKIGKTSVKHVKLDTERLADIKESITKADIKGLMHDGAITVEPKSGVSRGRARQTLEQKRKGRQKGHGSRKGKQNARLSTKEQWMVRVRKLRAFLANLAEKEKITSQTRKDLYKKCSGGYFRNLRHLKTYMEEHKLFK